jgi:superfamily I DNA/RNA helicase
MNDKEILRLLDKSRERSGLEVDSAFLRSEWSNVIDRQGLMSWEAYRDADRRGGGRPLSGRERQRLWDVFGAVWGELELANQTTWAGLCRLAADQLERGTVPSPFDAVVVDEVQDLSSADLRFLAALSGKGRDGLFLVGDAGQRIYPGGFSLRALGIDVRGRSRVLRINYRTTEQIQRVADRILGDVCDDLDEGNESRRGTVSLLRGPDPEFRGFERDAEERAFIIETTQRLIREGLGSSEIALFARTHKLAESFSDALRSAGIPTALLREFGEEGEDQREPGLTVGTMHSAKGLEFKAVFVAGCNDHQLPNAYVLSQITDPAEWAAALEEERRLFYVSVTRARDEVFVTWCGTPSRLFTAPPSGGAQA